jgi:hypothetical protein
MTLEKQVDRLPAYRRRRTNHGHDPLALLYVQSPLPAWAWLLIECGRKPLLLVAPGNRAYRRRSHAPLADVWTALRPWFSWRKSKLAVAPAWLQPLAEQLGKPAQTLPAQCIMHPMVDWHDSNLPLALPIDKYL